MRRKSVVTIATADFAAQSRVLARSARRCDPDARLVVLAVDYDGARPIFEETYDLVVSVEELPLSFLAEMRARYSIAELCFALKPWIIGFLLDKFPDEPVYYFDSDIELFSPLIEADAALAGGANLVVTPHILHPAPDQESEEALLRSGTLNAGFLAVAPTAQGRDLVGWWGERLRTGCTIDGTCGDQKWLELVPSICDGVTILRHPGYNFAFWNAHERPLSSAGGVWTAAGQPLRFVHYTKWNLRAQDAQQYLAAYFRRDQRQLAGLFAGYQQKVSAEGGCGEAPLPPVHGDRPAVNGTPRPELVCTAQNGEPFIGLSAIDMALIDDRERGHAALIHTERVAADMPPAPPPQAATPWRTDRLAAGDAAAVLPNGHRGAIEWLEFMNVGRAGERRDAGICSKPGQSGHLLYGPYIRLGAGDYRVCVKWSAGSPQRTVRRGQPVAAIETVTRYGRAYLAQRQLPVEDCIRPEHELLFRVNQGAATPAPIEIRVWTSGAVPLTVSSITVERIAAVTGN